MDFLVSIHAPVVGATANGRYVVRVMVVSIHAPVVGATGEMIKLMMESRFQSTLPWWERP